MTAEGTRDPEAVVEAQRDIQEEVARDERTAPRRRRRARCRPAPASIPVPPFPEQHQREARRRGEARPGADVRRAVLEGLGQARGKVALITGGDSGIGRAVAVLFAREGADVAIAYLAEDADAEETKAAVEAEGRRAILLRGDVADRDFCREAVARTVRELGGLDILVNNAAFQVHTRGLPRPHRPSISTRR